MASDFVPGTKVLMTDLTEASKTIDSFTSFFDGISRQIPDGIRSLARSAGVGLGISLNTFKSVTLSAPNFREFTLSWKLSPKNFAESQIIQKMVFAFKRGMTPDTRGAGFVFKFPQIYSMYFTPNSSFLYKFKPAVLKQISVNYAGGNPYASFYKSQGGNPANTPPESVIISMQFLELEYWIKKDFKPYTDTPDFPVPTNDPLDNWNFYNRNLPPPTQASQGIGSPSPLDPNSSL